MRLNLRNPGTQSSVLRLSPRVSCREGFVRILFSLDGLSLQKSMSFASIPEAIEDFRAGKMLVVVDDEDRENEGDLTVAAERITPEIINFMATHGRGLICLALTPEICDRLELQPMSSVNTARFGTAFCE